MVTKLCCQHNGFCQICCILVQQPFVFQFVYFNAQNAYYVEPLVEGPHQKISKGKLPDKYRNIRKLLKQAGSKSGSLTAAELDAPEAQGMYVCVRLTVWNS